MKNDSAAHAARLHETMLRHCGCYAPKASAAQIDRRADAELAVGRVAVVERLALAAAAMQEAGQ